MAYQPLYRNGTRAAATARRLMNSATQPAKYVLEATVEFLAESRDVIYRQARYGDLFFVRSPKFASRYYVVSSSHEHVLHCSCPEGYKPHEHLNIVHRYVQEYQLSLRTPRRAA